MGFERLFSRKKVHTSLKMSVDIAGDKIAEEHTSSGEDRIREPFDMIIDKSTITIENLRHWSTLPIEMLGTHLKDGRLVWSSGTGPSKTDPSVLGSTAYDWPDGAEDDVLRSSPPLQKMKMKLFPHMNPLRRADTFSHERSYLRQPYTIHNHPSDDSDVKFPSPNDLLWSGHSGSDVDIILTPDSIVLFKAPRLRKNETVAYQQDYMGKQGEDSAREYLAVNNIYYKEIKFGGNEKELGYVISFLQGKKKWRQIKGKLT